ncbi:MAG: DUF1289 domain-containing protein [Bacillota bacterium]
MSTVNPIPLVSSPCVGICTLDDAEYCVGCRRHISEIAGWLKMSDEERQRILAELPKRYRARTGGSGPEEE